MTTVSKNPTISEQLKKVIELLAEDLRPLVAEIHAMPPTTKNYYGSYMAILGKFVSNKGKMKLISLALIEAGANVYGIESAMSLLG